MCFNHRRSGLSYIPHISSDVFRHVFTGYLMYSARRLMILIVCLMATGWLLPNKISAQDRAVSQFAIPESDDGLPGLGPIRRYDWFKNLWINQN